MFGEQCMTHVQNALDAGGNQIKVHAEAINYYLLFERLKKTKKKRLNGSA